MENDSKEDVNHKAEELPPVMEALLDQMKSPEGQGNDYLAWNWTALLNIVPFIPYLLLLFFQNSVVCWVLHVYSLVIVLVMLRIIQGFKDEMAYVSNPFDFVTVELVNFLQVIAHFGFAFSFLEKAVPGSFSDSLSIFNGVYFSMVTIVTLGYGDIHPVATYAKVLTMFEVAAGLWFIVTVVPTAVADQAERIRHHRITRQKLDHEMREGLRRGEIRKVDPSEVSQEAPSERRSKD